MLRLLALKRIFIAGSIRWYEFANASSPIKYDSCIFFHLLTPERIYVSRTLYLYRINKSSSTLLRVVNKTGREIEFAYN